MTLEFPTVVIPPNNISEIKAILKRLDEEDSRATPEGEPNLRRRTKLDNQRVELKALDVEATEKSYSQPTRNLAEDVPMETERWRR
jgi:hypothetical protein